MTDLDGLLAGIVSDPLEETRWLVLADWLEEFDDPRRGELLRLHRKMLATCCEPDAHPERAAWQARMVELLVAGVRPCVPQETLTLPGGVPMTFSFIPPGAFLMGSDEGHESNRPVHRAEVSQGFFMGVHPVTEAQWDAVLDWCINLPESPDQPVNGVSWDDCREYCQMLTKFVSRRVELPTEIEWEYACRAGTTTKYHFGDAINPDLAHFNTIYDEESQSGWSSDQATPVGIFPSNAWSLFDVHGNVWEWCADEYRQYPGREQEELESSGRILRGGCFMSPPRSCCASARTWRSPSERYHHYFGFRVCLRLS